MAKSLLTQALDAVSGGEFSEPKQAVNQPVSFSGKTLQVTEASNRITNNLASQGQFPTLSGEIARFQDQAIARQAVQQQTEKDANDFFGSTQELTSGSNWQRFKGNVKNDLATLGGSIANIGLQFTQTPSVARELGILANRSDEERAAFNRENTANKQRTNATVERNALMAQDALEITQEQTSHV